jgi:D-beta-D-heptose 7-phosphate kinase/D-beta-D-heptose 1-phosphate adenosyltransferase
MVTLFSEDTPYELIQAIVPSVLVKGGDYDPDATDGPRYIVGSDVVRSHGGEVRVINFVEGRSTSGIIERIMASKGR